LDAPGKHAAMELAHDSGKKPAKCQRHSGAGVMYALSDAVQSMSGALFQRAHLLPAASLN